MENSYLLNFPNLKTAFGAHLLQEFVGIGGATGHVTFQQVGLCQALEYGSQMRLWEAADRTSPLCVSLLSPHHQPWRRYGRRSARLPGCFDIWHVLHNDAMRRYLTEKGRDALNCS